MSAPLAVTVPLLNPNEAEATLIALAVANGQPVRRGDLLAAVETTTSAGDISAERAGYVIGLRGAVGDLLRVGEVLLYLADTAAESPPRPESAPPQADGLPSDLRITSASQGLARQLGLDLESLPRGALLTEKAIRAMTVSGAAGEEQPLDPQALIVYGGGGHGKSLIELARAMGGYRIEGVLDDALPAGGTILGAPVLGGGEALPGLYRRGVRQAVNAVGGIGNLAPRLRVFERLAQAGFRCPAVIHPTAFIEASAQVADGAQVFPHAYVGSDVRLGFGCIVNTGAIVSHDVTLGETANVSPGAMLAGGVTVGARVLIGMGVTVNLGVTIGEGARIGNGATIKNDVPAGGVVRAGTVWQP
jgi:sugar O-acyltransferase (sialic acid O-acetyltransferase NeuD family)